MARFTIFSTSSPVRGGTSHTFFFTLTLTISVPPRFAYFLSFTFRLMIAPTPPPVLGAMSHARSLETVRPVFVFIT